MAEGTVFVILLIAGTAIGFLAGRLSASRPTRSTSPMAEPEPAAAAVGRSLSDATQQNDAVRNDEEVAPTGDVALSPATPHDETAPPTSDAAADDLLTGAEREELLWLRTRVEQQRSHIATLESLLELTRSNHETSEDPKASSPDTDRMP